MDLQFMEAAIVQAKKAAELGEVPIGCVIVKDNQIIASAGNERETTFDATAHAEVLAIRRASIHLKTWYLTDCDLYVTIEPCAMCAGAIINSRIKNVYYGANDKKAGCCFSLYSLPSDSRFNHTANIYGGILEDQCATLMKDFFKKLR